jgi:hypothetical protein
MKFYLEYDSYPGKRQDFLMFSNALVDSGTWQVCYIMVTMACFSGVKAVGS